MDVKMSKEDLDEGRLRWNYEEPYLLRKNPDTGYCERLSPEGGCCVYDDRPAACRIYDCRNDKRVWEDFEKRIPAAPPYFIVPLGEWDMPK
jgi:Fe-S-cluster containining protein